MQNLFNNPLFVGALGLVAVGYFAFTVVLPFFGNDASASSDMDVPMMLDEFEQTVAGDALPVGGSVSKDRIRWLRHVPRDPFGAGVSDGGAVVVDRLELPRLQALFTSASSRSAVIDDELVREGDLVAGLRIVKIDNDGVTVDANGERHRLEPQI